MLLDLQDPSAPLQFACDVLIVGAGPAGITIAKELSGSGLRVCLAEAGGWQEEADTHALYAGRSVGHPMDLEAGRHRLFGGSASNWGGRCAELDPIDFEARNWVAHSGWPIDLAELSPYYERAKIAGNFTNGWEDDAAGLASIGRSVPDFGSDEVLPYVWRSASRDMPITWRSALKFGYGPRFDWGRSYRDVLVADDETFVVLHANLVALAGADDGSLLHEATFRSLNGHGLVVRARSFVLCCSGVENARIALNLPGPLRARLDPHGNLGRYFAQHPRGRILSVDTTRAQGRRLQKTFNIFARPPRFPVQYELGFALSEAAQRRHEVLNASAAFYYFARETSAWAAARRLRERLRARSFSAAALGDVATLVRGSGAALKDAYKKYVSGFELMNPDPLAEVHIDLEQQPDPESRIRLDTATDPLGIPKVVVDWRISELERKTARVFAEGIGRVLKRLDLGEPVLADWLNSSEPLREEDLHGNYHFIGATRMAATPAEGVVDADCRAFGLENLYFAGASVFPTGGHANPTLTIVALAIRLADHLRAELAPPAT